LLYKGKITLRLQIIFIRWSWFWIILFRKIFLGRKR